MMTMLVYTCESIHAISVANATQTPATHVGMYISSNQHSPIKHDSFGNGGVPARAVGC
jgi:hypothetical protein